MRKTKKSIVSPRLKFFNKTISFQNIQSLKKEVTYNLSFFTFLKSWVGRAMGNETFYGDGLEAGTKKIPCDVVMKTGIFFLAFD